MHGAGFINFELHGTGLRTYPNGDSYEGGLAGAVPMGSGTLHFADGGGLEGNFVEGFAEGDAKLDDRLRRHVRGPCAPLPAVGRVDRPRRLEVRGRLRVRRAPWRWLPAPGGWRYHRGALGPGDARWACGACDG